MRITTALSLAAALFMIGEAHANDSDRTAEQPGWPVRNAEPSINGGLLGQFEGIVDFCAEENPKAARDYQAALRQINGSLRERDLAQARHTLSYQEARRGIKAMLSSIPRDQRKQACASLFSPSGV